jgi:spore coat polysaccharide biosynthesis predicted glycosyltransferase SpsG
VTRVVLRADAGHALGFGHVARMLALGDELAARGVEVVPMFGGDAPAIEAWAAARGWQLRARAWRDEDTRAAAARADAIVVDGLPALVGPGIMYADDGGLDLPAELVWNPNVHATGLVYTRPVRALLGRRYLVLGRAIRAAGRGACRPRTGRELRLAVTFGGSDPVNATAAILCALPAGRALVVDAIIGPGFRDASALAAAVRIARSAGHAVTVHRDPRDLPGLLARADAAVASAGGTLGELAFLGCPALAFAIAPDQLEPARAQAVFGLVAGGADWAALSGAELRTQLADFLTDDAARAALRTRALESADGLGAARVADELLAPAAARVAS